MLDRILFRNPWTLGLPALAAAAFLTADTVNLTLEGHLAPPPSIGEAPEPSPQARRDDIHTRALLDRNLFGALRHPPPGKSAGSAAARALDGPPDGCPHTSLDLTLLATFVRPHSADSVAVLRAGVPSTASTQVQVGASVLPGVEVTRIERGQVYLRHRGRCEQLGLDAVAARASETAGSPKPERVAVMVRKTGPTDFAIPRAQVQRALSDLPHIGRQIRIVPHFRGTKTEGYKVFAIRPASLFDQLGLENGDVLRRVDGYALDDPKRFLEIYAKLQEAPHVTLDLVRKGRRVTLNYDLDGTLP